MLSLTRGGGGGKGEYNALQGNFCSFIIFKNNCSH